MQRSVRKIILQILLSISLGIAMGLGIGWLVWPIRYVPAELHELHPAYIEDTAIMLAITYQAGYTDLETTRQNFARLGISDPGPYLADLAARKQASGTAESTVQALASLAAAFGTSPATPLTP